MNVAKKRKITKYGTAAASIMNNWEIHEEKTYKKMYNSHYKDIIKNVCRVNILQEAITTGD